MNNAPAAGSATAPAKATAKSWAGLAVLVLPLLLITIDGTVLILGLPAISAELSPTGVEQLWMIDIYALVLASLLVGVRCETTKQRIDVTITKLTRDGVSLPLLPVGAEKRTCTRAAASGRIASQPR
jgi:hypothetical protein